MKRRKSLALLVLLGIFCTACASADGKGDTSLPMQSGREAELVSTPSDAHTQAPDASAAYSEPQHQTQITATNETNLSILILRANSAEEYALPPGATASWALDRREETSLRFLWGEAAADQEALLPYVFFEGVDDPFLREGEVLFREGEEGILLTVRTRKGAVSWRTEEFLLDRSAGLWAATRETERIVQTTEIVNNTADLELTFDRLQNGIYGAAHELEPIELRPGERYTVVGREVKGYAYAAPGLAGEAWFEDFYLGYGIDYSWEKLPVQAVFGGSGVEGYHLELFSTADTSPYRTYRLLPEINRWYPYQGPERPYLVSVDPALVLKQLPQALDLRGDRSGFMGDSLLLWSEEPLYGLEVGGTGWAWAVNDELLLFEPGGYTPMGDLLPGSPMVLDWYSIGSGFIRLIRCTDAQGAVRLFTVSENGRGGDNPPLILGEYTASLVPPGTPYSSAS